MHKSLKQSTYAIAILALIPTCTIAAKCQDQWSNTSSFMKTHPHLIKQTFGHYPAISKQLLNEVIKNEYLASKNGHFTFLHGEPLAMRSVQFWWTKLYEVRHNISFNNEYLFTRFDLLSFHNPKTTYSTDAERKKILKSGGRDTVFMMHNLFSGQSNNNPYRYYFHNAGATKGVSRYPKTIQDVFYQTGFDKYYEKYKEELLHLERRYNSICPYGQILVLSFSPEALEKHVYLAYRGGRKRTAYLHNEDVKTHDTIKITTAMRGHLDNVEGHDSSTFAFCFVPHGLSTTMAGKGVKIFSCTGADPKQMQAYLADEQALFDKIKKDIEISQELSNFSYYTPLKIMAATGADELSTKASIYLYNQKLKTSCQKLKNCCAVHVQNLYHQYLKAQQKACAQSSAIANALRDGTTSLYDLTKAHTV